MAYQRLQVRRAAEVTPSDTENIPSISGTNMNGAALYVGGAGDVKVLMVGGDEVTFTGVAAGTFMPALVLRVFSTGTTATNIVALW